MYKRLAYLTFLVLLVGSALAQAADVEWIRAVYWDGRYPTAWAGDGSGTRDALQAAGYEVLDADQLKTWMTARIADKKYSVVVFARDVVPDTVVESQAATCTLRKYLDAGGKIVWYADIPFYYWGHATGAMDTWGDNGAPAVLGFNTSSAPRDSGNIVTITAAGKKWGLTQTWGSQRPLSPSVTTNVTILATDNAGNAPAWAKHYVANDNFRGFVRFRDTGGQADVQDIMRVAEYIGLKASLPSPADDAIGVSMPLLGWSPGSLALYCKVYFGTTPDLTEADLVAPQVFTPPQWYVFQYAILQPGTTYYWRVDGVESDGTVRMGDVWHFTAAPTTAFLPSPADASKWVDPNTDLSWTGGQGALKHDLYFSTDRAAVENRDDAVRKLSESYLKTYDPETLLFNTTYYWVVDEITAAGVKYAGDVWRFTTIGADAGARGEYFTGMTPAGVPALTRIDPTIDFSWGDNGPGGTLPVDQFSARWTADLEVPVEDTYTFTTNTDDGVRLWLNGVQIIDQWVDQSPTDASSAPIALKPGIYSLQMEYYENGGGATARLYWQSPSLPRQIIPAGALQPPFRAKAIYPQNTDANIPQDVVLVWGAGEKAVRHAVYFGEDETAVAEATPASTGIYRGTQALEETTFDPGGLEWNKTYYWRIDEVNDTEAESPWTGMVWSFTTADFLVVDDFETYDDVEGTNTRIYETWIDGWGTGNGSTVGNWEAPFAEQTIVHGGRQSMPFDYNNLVAPFYSEAYREFAPVQNWTVNGVTDLVLFVRGYPAVEPVAVTETAGKMTVTGSGADIWGTSDEFTFVYKTLSGNGTIVARVDSNGVGSNRWSKGGVMIRDSLDGGSTFANTVITGGDGNGAAFQWRAAANTNAAWDGAGPTTPVAPPYWVKIERLGDNLTGYLSADGKTWMPQGTTQTIAMSAPVYIGLCVTSHAATEQRTYEFSSIATTGFVAGDWQGAIITAPVVNSQQPLYVIVEDSTGKQATVVNPDPGAVNVTAWTEWRIPLSEFAGVNPARVERLYLGVGDKSPDGSGRIYIDDIRVTKPAP